MASIIYSTTDLFVAGAESAMDRSHPTCEKCGGIQVEATVTIRHLKQLHTGLPQNIRDGQWLHCHGCNHRWFVHDAPVK